MTHFRDLAPCTYFPFAPGKKLLAVGWLGPDHKYTKGKVARRVVVNLRRLLVQPWQPVLTPGWHDCEFCERRSRSFKFSYEGKPIRIGVLSVFVPGDGILYVAPSLILHYINAHKYSPPDEFCDAVKNCPEMRSDEYLQAVAANGPRSIVPKQRKKSSA